MAGSFVHEAVSDGSCTDCHSPHASSVRALLLDEVSILCKECHDVPDEMTTVLHTALSDGECTDCHQPHAGSLPKLLVGNYNNKRYPKGFNEEMYSLCFECHDTSLITGPAEGTEFRDGSKNLHDLHVQGAVKPNKYGIVKRGKARSCSVCHDPHGSSQSHNLIRNYSCEGVFCFTMTFYALEDGGKCMVGCHKPKSYHRTISNATSE